MTSKFIILHFKGTQNAYAFFLTREWSSDKVLITVRKFSVYSPHIIRCFHLFYAFLCFTNVEVNAPLTHLFGFCKVTVAKIQYTIYKTLYLNSGQVHDIRAYKQ